MAWVDLSAAFAYGTKLTSTQQQQLRDNITAAFNGDSGAPPLKNTALSVGTGSASGSIVPDTGVYVAGNAFSFNVNHYNDHGTWVKLTGHNTSAADYTARWGLFNEWSSGSATYADRWQYITATDNPFIFCLRDKATGKIMHFWESDDPPFMSLWKLDTLPADFERPVKDAVITDPEEIVLHKYPMESFLVLRDRIKAAKDPAFKTVEAVFDFDKDTNLFKPKNITEI